MNIAVLAALRGQEPGWVCLASCALDVLINAFAVYWATGLNDQGARSRFTVTSFPEDEIPAEPQWSPGSQKQTFAMDALQSDVSPSKSGVRKMYHGHTISFVISNHGAHAISSQAKSVSMHDGADSEADANSIEVRLIIVVFSGCLTSTRCPLLAKMRFWTQHSQMVGVNRATETWETWHLVHGLE